MALKPDRNVVQDDISFFMNEVTERGVVVVYDVNTAATGAAMDDALAVVTLPTGGVSGSRSAGLLMNDMVNIDLTRQHINWHQDEVQLGGKVTLLKNGWVVTNMTGASVPTTPGVDCFYDMNGRVTTANSGALQANGSFLEGKIGQFMSVPDANGYVKVLINIT